MPRDGRGNPFGIGSYVDTPDGPMTVQGFAVSENPLDRERIRQMIGGPRTYYWVEIAVVNPGNDRYADHTDHCFVDLAQRAGMKLPRDPNAAHQALIEAAVEGDKVVWGS